MFSNHISNQFICGIYSDMPYFSLARWLDRVPKVFLRVISESFIKIFFIHI